MPNFHRPAFAALVVAFALNSAASPARAAFDGPAQQCRATISKSAVRFAKGALKAITRCHKSRDRDGSLAGVDCNSLAGADPAGKLQAAEDKFQAAVAAKCAGTPADVLYGDCPAPCAVEVPTVTTFPQVVDCQVCLGRAVVEETSEAAGGSPTSPLADAGEAACHGVVTKATSSFFNAAMKIVAKCQAAAEKAGGDTITDCTQTNYAALTSKAYLKAFNAIAAACADVTLPSATLDACGGALTVFDLAACASDVTDDSAQQLVASALATDGSGTTTTTTTTTTTLPGTGDPQCPDLGELVLYSRHSNLACTSNADCAAPRTCDASLGTCSTTATLDSGWTGLAHGSDINDGVRTRARLYCPGPAGPTCGVCDVAGLDPEPGNCRCTNNTRQVCDEPFSPDADDCGGATCDCYFGSPFPLNSGGTPVCVVNRFTEDVTGTADVDAGAGEIRAALRSRVYLGATQASPCPTCGGKCSDDQSACTVDADCGSGPTCVRDTPDDGVRDGLCIVGESAGLPCDATGTNASSPARFGPAVGGGDYSLDCLPDNGKNVSGQGLRILLDQTTSTTSMTTNVDCDGPGAGTALCHCLVCSTDTSMPCNADSECLALGGRCSAFTNPTSYGCSSNADCTSVNLGVCGTPAAGKCSGAYSKTCTTNADCTAQPAGTCTMPSCTAKGSGIYGAPNGCDGGLCTDLGGGVGECTDGPDNRYCSGLLKADGGGILACQTNADCEPFGASAGDCSVLERRPCFLDTIAATGQPDPEFPVAVSTFCVPPTSNGGINQVAGLPGPGRVISQGAARTFCAGDHAQQYQPGLGGCP